MKLSLSAPFRWPFPPPPEPHSRHLGAQGVRRVRGTGVLTRGAMVGDVLLVIAWGASIPVLMWLGAAGGF